MHAESDTSPKPGSRVADFLRFYLIVCGALLLLGIAVSRFAICWSFLLSIILAVPVTLVVQRVLDHERDR